MFLRYFSSLSSSISSSSPRTWSAAHRMQLIFTGCMNAWILCIQAAATPATHSFRLIKFNFFFSLRSFIHSFCVWYFFIPQSSRRAHLFIRLLSLAFSVFPRSSRFHSLSLNPAAAADVAAHGGRQCQRRRRRRRMVEWDIIFIHIKVVKYYDVFWKWLS